MTATRTNAAAMSARAEEIDARYRRHLGDPVIPAKIDAILCRYFGADATLMDREYKNCLAWFAEHDPVLEAADPLVAAILALEPALTARLEEDRRILAWQTRDARAGHQEAAQYAEHWGARVQDLQAFQALAQTVLSFTQDASLPPATRKPDPRSVWHERAKRIAANVQWGLWDRSHGNPNPRPMHDSIVWAVREILVLGGVKRSFAAVKKAVAVHKTEEAVVKWYQEAPGKI